MPIQGVQKYLASSVEEPYFLVVGDDQYGNLKNRFSEQGFTFLRVSEYCHSDDKLPDMDGLFEHLRASSGGNDQKIAVLGLGEYLGLCGKREAASFLARLKDLSLGKAKVVLLLRGVVPLVRDLRRDPRFDHRRLCILENAECGLSFTFVDPSVGLQGLRGVKALLKALEEGKNGAVMVSTKMKFDSFLFTSHTISNAYEGICSLSPNLFPPSSCGNEDLWSALLNELVEHDGLLEGVIRNKGFSGSLEENFYSRISGVGYIHWLYFIALKSKAEILSNSYLRFVLNRTERFKDFKKNVLNAITDISRNQEQFQELYAMRKKLVEKFPESDIADFIRRNRKDSAESVYKLTDCTNAEREEIIAWIAQHKTIPELQPIYPDLAFYLKKYIFNCGELSDRLTEYFEAYKRQKVLDILEDDFAKQVESLAEKRVYNRLPTRDEIVDSLPKEDTYLYWVDALGVEYLAFIMEYARMRELSVSLRIGRAELPTLTSINRGFYDAWPGKKEKNGDLDAIKHDDSGGYDFENNHLPVHLARELDILKGVLERAATKLHGSEYSRVVIASDHGASRLAVLRRKEEKYETDTRGEHSGRCCKAFESWDLPFATEENGYLVLADYGRFKGSRGANVEVHGGASLEEVVVPIITLTLKDLEISVEMAEDMVTVDFRRGTEIILFTNIQLNNVSVVLGGKRYAASSGKSQHHKIALPDVTQRGDYPADVYAGDDLIGKITIKAQGKSAKINDDFDNLF